MRFFQPLLAALFAATAFAQADSTGPNAFNVPSGGYDFAAGSTVTLSWNPTTAGTVSLVLRSGNPGDLSQGTVITASTANTGSYTWAIPASTLEGSDYAIEIISNQDPSQVNYTPPIIITSTNLVPSSSAATGSLATPVSSTGSATGSVATMLTSASGSAATTPSPTMSPSPASSGKNKSSDVAVATSTVTGAAAPTGALRGAVAGLVAVGVGAVAVL